MPKSILVKRLMFSYYSAVLIIAVLVIFAQIIIQLTLAQEVNTRNYALLMSHQEIRSQRLLRNGLLILAGPKYTMFTTNYNDTINQFKADIDFLEQTNATLLQINDAHVFNVNTELQSIQSDFRDMDTEARQLLSDQDQRDMHTMGQHVSLLFVHQQKYLVGVNNAFTTLSQQADYYVTRVQIIEGILFVIAISVLIIEALAVIRPAIQNYDQALLKLKSAGLQDVPVSPLLPSSL